MAAAAVLPYLGSLRNPPILDDGWTALDNPLVWSLRNTGRIFSHLYGWAGTPSVRGPYRPLTTLSYALDWAVHRGWVPGFHAVNLALHAVASLLVAALALRLARAAAPARAGARGRAARRRRARRPARAGDCMRAEGQADEPAP